MCNKCFQGLMCVDEQAQYLKHLAAFSSSNPSSSSSRANATPARPGARPRQQRGRGVVFSNGVVIQKPEGLLPTKPEQQQQGEQQQRRQAAAATATAAEKPAASVLPL
jgi:hypothetical protein